jgi:hypothetical protein
MQIAGCGLCGVFPRVACFPAHRPCPLRSCVHVRSSPWLAHLRVLPVRACSCAARVPAVWPRTRWKASPLAWPMTALPQPSSPPARRCRLLCTTRLRARLRARLRGLRALRFEGTPPSAPAPPPCAGNEHENQPDLPRAGDRSPAGLCCRRRWRRCGGPSVHRGGGRVRCAPPPPPQPPPPAPNVEAGGCAGPKRGCGLGSSLARPWRRRRCRVQHCVAGHHGGRWVARRPLHEGGPLHLGGLRAGEREGGMEGGGAVEGRKEGGAVEGTRVCQGSHMVGAPAPATALCACAALRTAFPVSLRSAHPCPRRPMTPMLSHAPPPHPPPSLQASAEEKALDVEMSRRNPLFHRQSGASPQRAAPAPPADPSSRAARASALAHPPQGRRAFVPLSTAGGGRTAEPAVAPSPGL